jgi:hypothetical protein
VAVDFFCDDILFDISILNTFCYFIMRINGSTLYIPTVAFVCLCAVSSYLANTIESAYISFFEKRFLCSRYAVFIAPPIAFAALTTPFFNALPT